MRSPFFLGSYGSALRHPEIGARTWIGVGGTDTDRLRYQCIDTVLTLYLGERGEVLEQVSGNDFLSTLRGPDFVCFLVAMFSVASEDDLSRAK